ncbi:ATP-binding cassette domain-containing protein [Dermabacteraceae bacterium TAE3-ERU27]|nr:ATP-binding cassette domain-containing protein [Dermabacteraceae bacterium TAE3-ERU27]
MSDSPAWPSPPPPVLPIKPLALLCALAVFASLLPGPWWLPVAVAAVTVPAALLAARRCGLPGYARTLLLLWLPIALVVCAVQGLTYPEARTIYWQAGPLRVSGEGLRVAAAISARVAVASACGMLFALGLHPGDLLRQPRPARPLPRLLAIVCALCLAALPGMRRRVATIREVRTLRGLPPRALAGYALPLLQGTVADSDRVLDVLHSHALLPLPSPPLPDETAGAFTAAGTSLTYRGEASPALNSLSLSLAAGEVALLYGLSGSGRSSLCRLASGILLGDEAKASPAPRSAALPFRAAFAPTDAGGLTRTVAEEVTMAAGVDTAFAARLAELLEISEILPQDPLTISGGERERLAVLSCLASRPTLAALDQPFSGLDAQSVDGVWRAIALAADAGCAILLCDDREREIPAALAPRCKRFLLREGILEELPAGTPLPWAEPVLPPEESAVTGESDSAKDPAASFPAGEVVLRAEGLTRLVPGRSQPLYSELNLSLRRGELLVVNGRSGIGKTSLLRQLAGLDHGRLGPGALATGEVSCAGRAVVLQDQQAQLSRTSVLAEVMSARRCDGGEVSEESARRALSRCGLSEAHAKHPRELTSAELARLLLACALVRDADVLLLDEPTARCDLPTQRDLAGVIAEEQRRGRAILLVTHDAELLHRFGEQIRVSNLFR